MNPTPSPDMLKAEKALAVMRAGLFASVFDGRRRQEAIAFHPICLEEGSGQNEECLLESFNHAESSEQLKYCCWPTNFSKENGLLGKILLLSSSAQIGLSPTWCKLYSSQRWGIQIN